MFKVVSDFRDAKNNNHLYKVGDEYPVAGYKPSKARVEELAKGKNKYNRVFIEEVVAPAPAANPEVTPDVTPEQTPDQAPAEPDQNPEE